MISEYRVVRLTDVLAELKRKGYKSYASIERGFGISASFLSQVINQTVPLGEAAARNIENKLDLPALYLDKGATGNDDDFDDGEDNGFFTTDSSTAFKDFHIDPVLARIKNKYDMNVPAYSNLDFTGDGNYDFVGVKYHIEMPKRFFEKYDIEPQNFRLIGNNSDSMKPYINSDDDVGIDISKTDIIDGHIYLLGFDGDVMIKQIFREGGGALRLHSHNPDYPDRFLNKEDTNSLLIIGKQIYRAG